MMLTDVLGDLGRALEHVQGAAAVGLLHEDRPGRAAPGPAQPPAAGARAHATRRAVLRLHARRAEAGRRGRRAEAAVRGARRGHGDRRRRGRGRRAPPVPRRRMARPQDHRLPARAREAPPRAHRARVAAARASRRRKTRPPRPFPDGPGAWRPEGEFRCGAIVPCSACRLAAMAIEVRTPALEEVERYIEVHRTGFNSLLGRPTTARATSSSCRRRPARRCTPHTRAARWSAPRCRSR